jgi:hypothetical protein
MAGIVFLQDMLILLGSEEEIQRARELLHGHLL